MAMNLVLCMKVKFCVLNRECAFISGYRFNFNGFRTDCEMHLIEHRFPDGISFPSSAYNALNGNK